MTTNTQDKAATDLWNEVAAEREDGPASAPPVVIEAAAEVTEPADEVKTPAAAAPVIVPPVEEEDLFKGLNPKLKAEIERLSSIAKSVPELTNQLSRNTGRVAALQSELDAAKAVKTAGGPTDAQINAAAKSTDKWDTLKGDFPEWADATEQLITARIAGINPGSAFDADAIAKVIEDRVQEATASTAKLIEEAKVEGKHPNWLATLADADFHTWKNAQAPEVQSLFSSPKGRDGIRMLDLYEEAKAKPAGAVQAARATKLAAAAGKAPGTDASNVTKAFADMTPAEQWNHEASRAQKRNADSGLRY